MSENTRLVPAPRTKVGRKRILADPEKRRTLCAMIAVGAGLEAAADHVGCSVRTIRREAERDPAFASQLVAARKELLLYPLRAMHAAASTHWRAAAWMLERSFQLRFAHSKPEQQATTMEKLDKLADQIATIRCANAAERDQPPLAASAKPDPDGTTADRAARVEHVMSGLQEFAASCRQKEQLDQVKEVVKALENKLRAPVADREAA